MVNELSVACFVHFRIFKLFLTCLLFPRQKKTIIAVVLTIFSVPGAITFVIRLLLLEFLSPSIIAPCLPETIL